MDIENYKWTDGVRAQLAGIETWLTTYENTEQEVAKFYIIQAVEKIKQDILNI